MPRSGNVTGRASVIPKRLSLVRQTADILGREIARGTWIDWLPSERILSQSLQISRPTLRQALQILQRDGAIKAVKGRGHRIMMARETSGQRLADTTIHLLCPDRPDQLQQGGNRWVEELRALLFQTNSRLLLHHGPQFQQSDPGPALESLTGQCPGGYWVLARTSPAIQRWFEDRRENCLVAGYTHPGIKLPAVYVDLESACRDAVRVFKNRGHSEVGFLYRQSERARDVRSTAGFEAGLAQEAVRGRLVAHDGTIASILDATRYLQRSDCPATAILTESAFTHATVSTFLMQEGKHIPDDVGLIARTHEPFLDSLLPQPACYHYDPTRFGRLVHGAVVDLFAHPRAPSRQQPLVPDYRPGQSV